MTLAWVLRFMSSDSTCRLWAVANTLSGVCHGVLVPICLVGYARDGRHKHFRAATSPGRKDSEYVTQICGCNLILSHVSDVTSRRQFAPSVPQSGPCLLSLSSCTPPLALSCPFSCSKLILPPAWVSPCCLPF